jgi:Family of unknown function (DUF6492)
MTTLAVLTPSIAADYERCADLNRSVLAQSDGTVEHHIVVPARDLPLFERLSGPRTRIRRESDFLPRSFVPVPRTKYTLNVRRPYPPLRGWILQQIVKLAAAAELPADVVVMADSDITFCRPLRAGTFMRDGVVRLFREPGGVHEGMPRHVLWHRAARSLLGLPGGQPPFTDYVSSMLAWDPAVVRAMLARVTEVTGRPWADAIGAHLHFSEWTLYGVFVDQVLGAPANSFASDDPLCHTYWLEEPLDAAGLDAFLAGIAPDDIAVMVSAKSRTPMDLQRAAMARLPQYAPQLEPPSSR